MQEQEYESVLRIQSALSNKPTFIKVGDLNYSMDRVILDAISNLKNSGKPLEGEQLEQLYKQHQLFSQGKVVQKGDLLKDLFSQKDLISTQSVRGREVQVLSIDMVSSHSGGGGIEISSSDSNEDDFNLIKSFLISIKKELKELNETTQKILRLIRTK